MRNILYAICILFVAVSCDKEEVTVNTGPLFITDFTYEGLDSEGENVSGPLVNNAQNIPLNSSFRVTFSKEVDPSTINEENIYLTSGDTQVPVTIEMSDEVLTITPDNNLAFDNSYTLVLSDNIKGADGGYLAETGGDFGSVNRILNTPGNPLIAYWSFDDDFEEHDSGSMATEVGNIEIVSESAVGTGALQAATDSYLTFPADGLTNSEFSAAFWYKIDADPTRAGILVMSPVDDTPPANDRTEGFRFFREGSATNQTFKLNVGRGDAETWVDGGAAASINPTEVTDWIHLAFTISPTEARVYINGEMVKESALSQPISWNGVNLLSIGSGAPNFVEWGHLSDQSSIDDLKIFNIVLTQSEIQAMMEE